MICIPYSMSCSTAPQVASLYSPQLYKTSMCELATLNVCVYIFLAYCRKVIQKKTDLLYRSKVVGC